MREYVRIANGNLYLKAEIYQRWFEGVQTVVLLGDSQALFVAPITHSPAGGLLMKIRNARGDRVIHASEALIGRGLPSDLEGEFPATWDRSTAALRIDLTPPSVKSQSA